jgi:hypothetical protein
MAPWKILVPPSLLKVASWLAPQVDGRPILLFTPDILFDSIALLGLMMGIMTVAFLSV